MIQDLNPYTLRMLYKLYLVQGDLKSTGATTTSDKSKLGSLQHFSDTKEKKTNNNTVTPGMLFTPL